MAACPYDAIFINPEDHSAEKCNFCAHRIDVGLEPACVVVCPTQAILIGDLNDQTSYVAQIVNREAVNVRRPEKETLPKLFYKGAHQATLDPLAARRPEAGLFMWSEQQQTSEHVVSGNPTYNNTSAAALLSYDVAHSIPWDWRVSLYTWTKGIASGVYLVAGLLVLFGFLNANNWVWLGLAPIISGAFLVITGGLLVWDLEHPERFYLIFTRPQWRSWLVRGGVILTAFGAAIGAHLLWSLFGSGPPRVLAIAGGACAIGAGTYTAWLFAQAKARDLWQSPLLPPQHLIATLLAGAAALLIAAAVVAPDLVPLLTRLTAAATLIHLALAFVIHHPAVTSAIVGPRTLEQLEGQLGAVDVRLSEDVLDAVDQIVPPGTNFNPADAGWRPPHLDDPASRRRLPM